MYPIHANRRLEMAAALAICLTLSISVLYPENFITGVSFLGSSTLDPLLIVTPLLAIIGIPYIVSVKRSIRPNWTDALVLSFFSFLILRNINGPSGLSSLKYVGLSIFVFYLIALLSARSKSLPRPIVITLAGLLLLTAAYGLLEYVFQSNFIYAKYISVVDPSSGIHRSGSSLAHPVVYGAFILQILPFVVAFWTISRSVIPQSLALISMLASALALFFTYSKGSWITAIIIACGVLLFGKKQIKKKIIYLTLVIVAIIGLTGALFWQDIESEIQGRISDSVSTRMEAWHASLAATVDHPVFGVGFLQGNKEIVKYVDQEWYALLDRPLTVDNLFFSLLLEGGVVGFGIWAVMLAFIIREGISLVRWRRPERIWAVVALVSLASICINAVSFIALFSWSNNLLFWLAAGLIHGLNWHGGPVQANGNKTGMEAGTGRW